MIQCSNVDVNGTVSVGVVDFTFASPTTAIGIKSTVSLTLSITAVVEDITVSGSAVSAAMVVTSTFSSTGIDFVDNKTEDSVSATLGTAGSSTIFTTTVVCSTMGIT
uniref:Uncharacterized protein n=1 Tax=Panagrolaimus superbus TaxID=310955 RepID=A0A914Y5Z0_9BILA